MSIITVNRNICRTYVSLSEFACGCDLNSIQPTDVSIVLRRVGPGVLVCEQVYPAVGCGAVIGPRKQYARVSGPGIKYVGFDRDASGRVGFLWDSKFLEAVPGRWDGIVSVCGKPVVTLRFQLGSVFAIGDDKCVENDACPIPSACPPVCT
jgi:hypothetical protein